MKKVIIIGGIAAGTKVGTKLKRLQPDWEVTIIDKNEIIAFGGCGMPYYIGGKVKREELYKTQAGFIRDPIFFKEIKGVNVLNKTEALKIDREKKEVKIKDLRNNEIRTLSYDYLVLATGSKPFIPNIEGNNLKNVFTLHNLSDADIIKEMAESEKAVIIGGGLIGLEITENLIEKNEMIEVSIIEMLPEIIPFLDPDMAFLVRKFCESQGVNIYTSEKIVKLVGDENGKVKSVITENNEFDADFVIMATGFKPNVDLAKECGIELGITGAIKVNERMQTNDPFIYAVGDCIEVTNLITGSKVYVPSGSTANKQGRVAAINIAGFDETYPGVVQSVIFKIFEYNVAKTGLSSKEALSLGYDIESVLCPGMDKPHYYPGHKIVQTKLIVDKKTGKLLGAQFVGMGDVTKSVNVASTVLHFNGLLKDISNFDLAYSPPYSSAIDNICTAANVLINKLEGRFQGITSIQAKEKIGNDSILFIDVREPSERRNGFIEGSILIPLGELRKRISEIPTNKEEIIVFCQLGLRSYEAAIILKSHGFKNVKVLEGGIHSWMFELKRR